jgi:transmembrane sensor
MAAGVAAIIVLAAGAGWHWLGRDLDDFRTAVGERKPIVLSDGTHVLLNTDTRLRKEVTSARRGVRLEQGEAYFEVAHDAAHPFVIDAGDCTITVLGTRFDVRRDGGTVRVTVVEGKVRVSSRDDAAGDHTVMLLADDSAVVTATSAMAVHRGAADTTRALTWRSGRISFDDTTLEAAALEFNRYNTRKLVVEGQRAAGMRIGGSFDANNVEAFAHLLHTGFGLSVRDDGKSIHVSG